MCPVVDDDAEAESLGGGLYGEPGAEVGLPVTRRGGDVALAVEPGGVGIERRVGGGGRGVEFRGAWEGRDVGEGRAELKEVCGGVEEEVDSAMPELVGGDGASLPVEELRVSDGLGEWRGWDEGSGAVLL